MSTLSIVALIALVLAIATAVWFYHYARVFFTMVVVAALSGLLLVISFLPVSVPSLMASQPVSLTEPMKVEIQRQIDAANTTLAGKVSELTASVKAVTDKDIEQDARLAKIEGRLDTLESKMKAAEADIAAFKDRLKSVENGDVTVTGSPTDLTAEQATQALADELVAQGWQPDQINVGTIDWSKNPYDNGRETFVNRTIRTQQDLARVLAHPKNGAERAVRAHILKSLKGMPESERQRAMTGQGFVPVQFLDESCFNGNTFYNAGTGTAEREAGDVCKKAGDVWWIYVDSNGKVQWDTAVRADCGNPGLTRPPRPKHPKPTPTPTPTTPTSTPSTTPTPTPTSPTPTPTTPTPTPTTPTPTPTQSTLEPKPTDKASWTVKPSAPPATVTEPAKPTPDPVETSKPTATATRSTPPPATGANSPKPTETTCVPAPGKTDC